MTIRTFAGTVVLGPAAGQLTPRPAQVPVLALEGATRPECSRKATGIDDTAGGAEALEGGN